MVQKKVDRFWATRVRSITFDIASHFIHMVVLVDGKELSLRFTHVSAFRFDSALQNWSPVEDFSWENIELSEIHFIPELPPAKQQLADPQNVGYNFVLELYSSKLFIRAKNMRVDDDMIL